MKFLKDMKAKSKFKDGRLVDVDEMPDNQDRDEFLVNYSIKNNIPIVISNQQRWGDLKYLNPNVHLLRIAPKFTFEVKEAELPNGILIDESVSIEMITWIKENNIKIRGGFK